MEKITNFSGVKSFWCTLCNHTHLRRYNYEINEFGKRIKKETTPFFLHQKYAVKLTNSELFRLGFKASWNSYSITAHKQTYRSRKQ